MSTIARSTEPAIAATLPEGRDANVTPVDVAERSRHSTVPTTPAARSTASTIARNDRPVVGRGGGGGVQPGSSVGGGGGGGGGAVVSEPRPGGLHITPWSSISGTGRSFRLRPMVGPSAENHLKRGWHFARNRGATDERGRGTTSDATRRLGPRGGAMAFTPYLAFAGDCRAAFTRYQEIFGGELVLLAMSDMPETPGSEPVPAEKADLVAHAALTSGDQLLMGADDPTGGFDGHVRGMCVSV